MNFVVNLCFSSLIFLLKVINYIHESYLRSYCEAIELLTRIVFTVLILNTALTGIASFSHIISVFTSTFFLLYFCIHFHANGKYVKNGNGHYH